MRWFSLAPPISDLSLLVWIWHNTDKLIHSSINPPFCMKWSLILLMWHQWFVCCFHLLTWCVVKAAAVACIWYPLSDLFRFQIPNVIEAAHVHRASYTYSTISILYYTVGTGFMQSQQHIIHSLQHWCLPRIYSMFSLLANVLRQFMQKIKIKKNLQSLQTLSQLFGNEMQHHHIIFLLL